MKQFLKDRTGSTILYLLLAILLQIILIKVFTWLMPGESVSANANFLNKILMVFIAVETIVFLYLTPLEINWAALRILPDCKWKREWIEALLVSAVLVVAMLIYRWILNYMDPQVAERPVFGLYLHIHARWFYPINVVLQELFVKAVVQHNIGKNIGGKHLSIWINALFFGIFHMTYPLYYLLGAVLLCGITGYLYERDKNIWGSALIHFVIGFMPRALGLKV